MGGIGDIASPLALCAHIWAVWRLVFMRGDRPASYRQESGKRGPVGSDLVPERRQRHSPPQRNTNGIAGKLLIMNGLVCRFQPWLRGAIRGRTVSKGSNCLHRNRNIRIESPGRRLEFRPTVPAAPVAGRRLEGEQLGSPAFGGDARPLGCNGIGGFTGCAISCLRALRPNSLDGTSDSVRS